MATNVTADGRARVLADGNEIPLLGLGVWQVDDGRECENAVRWALELGYRHIDTAQAYRNERSVGKALRDSGVPRDEVFITTKFYPGGTTRRRRRSASSSGSASTTSTSTSSTGRRAGRRGRGTACSAPMRAGYARSIGVSNFSVAELDELLRGRRRGPVVNQVQFSPFEFRRELWRRPSERAIALEAYSPLGTGRHLGDARVARSPSASGARRPRC